ncbi:MAG: DUF3459 domain-containing protein, partial [Anaerolineae bacterium]
NAGFTAPGVTPWLPVSEDYERVNVAAQRRDPTSTLSLYRRLLALRRERPPLHRGDFAFVPGMPDDVLAYTRQAGDDRALVVINFADEARTVDLSAVGAAARLLLSTQFSEHSEVDLSRVALEPHEGLLLALM